MEKSSEGAIVMGLSLGLLAVLACVPSANAQQLSERSALVNPGPAINSAAFQYESVGREDGARRRMKLVSAKPSAWTEESLAPMAGVRINVAPASVPESGHFPRVPAFYQEDTAFSTQVRVPVADLLGGRLQFDGYYLNISANSVFRGLPQCSNIGWASAGSLTLRPATSYGIRLSFRMPHIRPRTLCRYLFG